MFSRSKNDDDDDFLMDDEEEGSKPKGRWNPFRRKKGLPSDEGDVVPGMNNVPFGGAISASAVDSDQPAAAVEPSVSDAVSAPVISPAKQAKAAKKAKAPKAEANEELDEDSLPILVNLDFYRGVSKIRDAEAYARSFIEKNFDAPNASYYKAVPWRDGIAVEMQMGGGRSYLTHVLAELDADASSVIALPMSNRVMTVRFDEETDRLECLILNAGQLPPEDAVIAKPDRMMEPFDRRGFTVFIMGVGVFLVGMLAMLAAIGIWFFDVDAWAARQFAQTRAKDVPALQAPQIQAALQTGDCVAKVEFRNGDWTVMPGWNLNGVCSTDRNAALASQSAQLVSSPPVSDAIPSVEGALAAPVQPAPGQPAPIPSAAPVAPAPVPAR